jgi:Flp pilus assembly protein TadD
MDRRQEAVRLEPTYARAHGNLGAALQRLGERDRAVWHCREAPRLDPQLEQARHNLDVLMRARRS